MPRTPERRRQEGSVKRARGSSSGRSGTWWSTSKVVPRLVRRWLVPRARRLLGAQAMMRSIGPLPMPVSALMWVRQTRSSPPCRMIVMKMMDQVRPGLRRMAHLAPGQLVGRLPAPADRCPVPAAASTRQLGIRACRGLWWQLFWGVPYARRLAGMPMAWSHPSASWPCATWAATPARACGAGSAGNPVLPRRRSSGSENRWRTWGLDWRRA